MIHTVTAALLVLALLFAAVSVPVGLFVAFAAVLVEVDSRLARRDEG